MNNTQIFRNGKPVVAVLCSLVLVAVVWLLSSAAGTLQQARADEASGTWGTCPWELSSSGVLTIHPGEGDLYSKPWDGAGGKLVVTAVVAKAEDNNKVVLPENCAGLFDNMTNMKKADLSGADTSKVTDMSSMFNGCEKLASVNVSGWDTSKVTNMTWMFANCEALKTLDLSGIDSSKVTDLSYMFYGCSKLKQIKFAKSKTAKSKFTTAAATTMNSMFAQTGPLEELDLSQFNTSKVMDMQGMFELSRVVSLDVSGWSTMGAPLHSSMFSPGSSLIEFKVGSKYAMADRDILPEPNNADKCWFSKNKKKWFSVDEMVKKRSKQADTYYSYNPSRTNIEKGELVIAPDEYDYNGKEQHAGVDVVLDNRQLLKGVEYTCTFKNCKKVGTATVTVKGKGPYKGKLKGTYKIVRTKLSKVEATIAPQPCTGKVVKPVPKVTLDGVKLKKGKDFTITSTSPGWGAKNKKKKKAIKPGECTEVITGKGNFKGKKKIKFEIVPVDINRASASAIGKKHYTGAAIKPAPKLTYKKKQLVKGTDYTLSYDYNVEVGTAYIFVHGKGNFTGTKTLTFDIAKGKISSAKASAIKAQEYTGAEIRPALTLKIGKVKLKEGADYTLKYSNNVKIGTATITITGMGNFTGTKKVKFKIGKCDNPMKVSTTVVHRTPAELGKEAKTDQAITVTGAAGKVTMKKVGKSTLKLVGNGGKVKTPKGTGKGSYTMKVKVKAAGDKTHKAKTVEVVVKVVVKKADAVSVESETNDNVYEADTLAVGKAVRGVTSSKDNWPDEDWYCINVTSAGTYKVALTNLKGKDSDDTILMHVLGTYDEQTYQYQFQPPVEARVDVGTDNHSKTVKAKLTKGKNYLYVYYDGKEGSALYSVKVVQA